MVVSWSDFLWRSPRETGNRVALGKTTGRAGSQGGEKTIFTAYLYAPFEFLSFTCLAYVLNVIFLHEKATLN